MRGVGVKENLTSSIQDWQIMIFNFFFENAILFWIFWVDMEGGGVKIGQKLATSFMDGP